MLKGLTNTFKTNCNKTELTYNEYIIIDNQQIPVRAKLSDDCYENGNFIGSFILKTIQFETSNDVNFKKKEFEYYKVVDNESIKIGTFITTEIEDNDTTELVKVVGMDYGLKTQVEYTSELNYDDGQVTLLDVWNEACTLSNIQSGVQHFTNDDFIVDSDQFSGTGATIRDVFVGIAMSSGSFIKVMNDDKIYPIFTETTNEIIEDYTQLEDKRDTQPITCLRLGSSVVEGENVDIKDPELIEEYGENWLILNDNPFAYTQTKRSQLITAIFNKVKGFGYSAFVSKTSFKPYLTCGDLVRFKNKNGDLINSIILRYTHEYKENDMQITLEAPSETSATVNYVYPLDAIDIAKRTEIIVDKEEQRITELAEEVGTYSDRITTVEQTVDRIEQTAITTEDLKRNVKATNLLHITNAYPSYPLRFSIKNASLIFPSNDLYPSNTLYTKGSYLVIDKTQQLSQDAKFVKIPLTKLYVKDDVFDELVIEKKDVYLIHRIGVNLDGTTYILSDEIIEDLGTIDIELFEGDNYIYLYSFQNEPVIYEITYTIPSDFTDEFATEVYVDSSISQTANEIMLQVHEKVDEDEIIAKLNVAVEDGQGVINLIGNSVTIDSDNCKLDEEGNLECNRGTFNNSVIKNGSIELISTSSNPSFIIKDSNGNETLNLSDIGLYIEKNDYKIQLDLNTFKIDYNNYTCFSLIRAYDPNYGYYGILIMEASLSGQRTAIYPFSVESPEFINTSLEKAKKNIKPFDNALDIIKKSDIYSYNWKDEKNSENQHYGLVIGKDYNTPKEFISKNGKGVDLYAISSICLQAIKEQQEEIEKLKKEIQSLKEEK